MTAEDDIAKELKAIRELMALYLEFLLIKARGYLEEQDDAYLRGRLTVIKHSR